MSSKLIINSKAWSPEIRTSEMPPSATYSLKELKTALNQLKMELACSSIGTYRGSGRLSSEFWPIMNSCGIYDDAEPHHWRYRRKPEPRCSSVSAMFTVVFPWTSWLPRLRFQDYPNLAPRVIRVIVKSQYWKNPKQKRDLWPSSKH